MTQNKKSTGLGDYISTVKKIKPSAEVKFKKVEEDGTTSETSASRTYVSEHMDKEIAVVEGNTELSNRLNRIAETHAVEASKTELDEAIDIDAEQLNEFVTVEPNPDDASPLTDVPNSQAQARTTAELSETAILIQLVATLIDKVDQMQNFNPVIHVPAPVIHVTMPETRKTVTKAIERDENNFIKHVRESIEETPMGEPLIEVTQKGKE